MSGRGSHGGNEERRPYRVTRAQAAADALGSVRAEGLDPSGVEPILAAWARGELTDQQLEEVSKLMVHNRDLTAEQLLDRASNKDAASGRKPGSDASEQ